MISKIDCALKPKNSNQVLTAFYSFCIQGTKISFEYRTRANNGRSQLVAAPLSSQAKMNFLLAFYVTI